MNRPNQSAPASAGRAKTQRTYALMGRNHVEIVKMTGAGEVQRFNNDRWEPVPEDKAQDYLDGVARYKRLLRSDPKRAALLREHVQGAGDDEAKTAPAPEPETPERETETASETMGTAETTEPEDEQDSEPEVRQPETGKGLSLI